VTGSQTSAALPRLTPWVGRLLAINAVILLLQQTIFTSDSLAQFVAFDPALALQRPWTFVTYIFVHGGILHLAANSLALFVFGPAVEQQFGSRAFIAYYLYCGIAAAVFALVLNQLGFSVGPFIGASGAIIGVAYAFARLLPETPLVFLLLPIPIKAKWMIPLLASYDLIGLLAPLHDGIAHSVHIGGLLAGIVYFVLRGMARPPEPIPMRPMRPRVPVVARGNGNTVTSSHAIAPRKDALPQASHDADAGGEETVEIDRVLDKISASGLGSLTAEERRFLDTVARRRRDLN
jgi:membrane associated rhomboid family serine protease